MKKSAAILLFLTIVLFITCLLLLSSTAAQDAGICPASTMCGELEFPMDMLFDLKELDKDPTDGRIEPGSCANITIFKGGFSYTWESSDPVNFTLDENLTEKKGAINRVCLSKDACGSATITVTDDDGRKYMLSVLSFLGRWGDWTPWIMEDDFCAGEYYASNITDYCGDKSIQYNAAFWGAQKYHDECPTSWAIYSENCSATFHAFPGFWTISAASIRERQWICSSPKTTD
jgi:hypothetical protein